MIHKVTMTFEILIQLLLRKEAATVEKSDFSQISGLLSKFLELNDKKNPTLVTRDTIAHFLLRNACC